MSMLDVRMLLKDIYSATKQPRLVQVPRLTYFMFDGRGHPAVSSDFHPAIASLYTLAYTLKFEKKKLHPEQDYKVMPLEGLWKAGTLYDFDAIPREDWLWTLMIMQPPRLDPDEFAELVERAAKKKPELPLDRVQLAALEEGTSAQVMHVGPYSHEGPAVESLMEFMAQQGYEPYGKHHEIYLSDPNRVPEEKRKTIIRYACRPVARP